MAVGVSSTGVAGVLLALGATMFGDEPPPTVKISDDGRFLHPHWHEDAVTGPSCNFYNSSFQYTTALCSHFALARMSAAVQAESLKRAFACAAYYETDCVLSPEVGLAVPAAFVYDELQGLKMAIAPKILSVVGGEGREENAAGATTGATTTTTIEVRDPNTSVPLKKVQMHDTIEVEFLEGVSRTMGKQIFSGSAAFCVQLLRVAFDRSCWSELD